MTDLPDDADGDALRRLLNHGSDLGKPMEIDFHVACPDQASCEAVAAAAERVQFAAECVHDEDARWTCWCTRTMIPCYGDLLAVQALLDDLAHPHGGHADGWGSFGNAPE